MRQRTKPQRIDLYRPGGEIKLHLTVEIPTAIRRMLSYQDIQKIRQTADSGLTTFNITLHEFVGLEMYAQQRTIAESVLNFEEPVTFTMDTNAHIPVDTHDLWFTAHIVEPVIQLLEALIEPKAAERFASRRRKQRILTNKELDALAGDPRALETNENVLVLLNEEPVGDATEVLTRGRVLRA